MTQLTIIGHKTRGKEVIEILEMLGGNNLAKNTALYDNLGYFICIETRNIYYDYLRNFDSKYVTVFTLEEFLEKYPYKVGDKVQHKSATSCGSVFEVEKLLWEDNQVKYIVNRLWYNNDKIKVTVKDLQPYKEETMEGKDTINNTTEINLNHPCFEKCNEIELIIPDGWEFKRKDNKMFGVRKQYPKTYVECCEILYPNENFQTVAQPIKGHNGKKLFALQKLLVCRDAYWKIAGEKMGLGEPWKPDWSIQDSKNIIVNKAGVFKMNEVGYYSRLLAFPTAEMRDMFYENFKERIEQCKELL